MRFCAFLCFLQLLTSVLVASEPFCNEMAFVSPANLALEDSVPEKSNFDQAYKGDIDNVTAPSHGMAPDGHKPTLSEYQYYARLKREAEDGGYSGNG